MRARLLGIAVSLVVLVILALGVPLALSVASTEGQRLLVDRLTDTERFASLAQRPLTDQTGSLTDVLDRYEQVYGIKAVVLDLAGRPVFGSVTPVDLTDSTVRAAVDEALAGRPPPQGPTLLPWTSTPLVVAEPVLADGELRGVAVTVSDTGHVRSLIWRQWGLITVGAVLAIGLAMSAALPIVRWILRPVGQLEEATTKLMASVSSGHDVAPIGDGGGPAELRQLARSFDQMALTVVDAMATLRAFVADASHQLRGPITALLARLDSLDGEVTAEAHEHYQAAMEESDRLRQLVDELLALAAAESWQAESAPVDVDKVVKACVAACQPLAADRRISLVLAGERGGYAVSPPGGLVAVLAALLDNALKFTREDTLVEVAVRRVDAPTDASVVVSVRDHGPGLRPDELDQATKRFWRSKEHVNIRGSGLGLAIVSQSLQRVGGSISLDLPENSGLRVRVTLPAVAEPSNLV